MRFLSQRSRAPTRPGELRSLSITMDLTGYQQPGVRRLVRSRTSQWMETEAPELHRWVLGERLRIL